MNDQRLRPIGVAAQPEIFGRLHRDVALPRDAGPGGDQLCRWSSLSPTSRSLLALAVNQTPDSEGSGGLTPTDPSRRAGKSPIVDSHRFIGAPPAMICPCQQCF